MRNGYRSGRRQLVTLVSDVLHAQVKSRAAVAEVSMADWVADAIRERIEREQPVVVSVPEQSVRPSLDELLERGRALKVGVVVDGFVSGGVDPLEEIA